MAKRKPIFPKEILIEEMESNNKRWFDEYKLKMKRVESYYVHMERFLRYRKIGHKPFNTITKAEVWDYVDELITSDFSAPAIHSFISALSSFRNFHVKTNKNDFRKDFLEDLSTEFDLGQGGKFDDEPLDVAQIQAIRAFNEQSIFYTYIFELYFQLGIDQKDIVICRPQKADKQQRKFVGIDQSIKYNAKIGELIEEFKVFNDHELTVTKVNEYLSKITRYLRDDKKLYSKERNLAHSDLQKSFNKYMIKCPNCGTMAENIASNWVLAKTEPEEIYRLVCAQCKGKPNEN